MPLFKGLSEPQIQQALESFHAYTRCYDKGTYLLSCGQPPQFGLVIAGEVHIIKEDFWGHRSLLAQLGPGALFGESFSLSATPSLPVSVLAGTQVEALFFRAELFFQPSVVSACSISLVTNLLGHPCRKKSAADAENRAHLQTQPARKAAFLSLRASAAGA